MKIVENESLIRKVEKVLVEIIKTNVANGEYKLPPEGILCEKLGISRTVLRDALSHLQAFGYILRRRSKGTIINRFVIEAGVRIDMDCDVEDIILNSYNDFEYSDIEIHEIKADDECVQRLNVRLGDPLVMIKKKYKVNGKIVAFDIDIFLKELIIKEYSIADFNKPIYQFFLDQCNTIVEIMVSRISAREYEGKLYLHIDEVGNNIMQVPILWSRQYYSSEHLKYLSIIRRKAKCF